MYAYWYGNPRIHVWTGIDGRDGSLLPIRSRGAPSLACCCSRVIRAELEVFAAALDPVRPRRVEGDECDDRGKQMISRIPQLVAPVPCILRIHEDDEDVAHGGWLLDAECVEAVLARVADDEGAWGTARKLGEDPSACQTRAIPGLADQVLPVADVFRALLQYACRRTCVMDTARNTHQ